MVVAHLNGSTRHYVAREVQGAEREHLWQLAAAQYPGYDAYQARVGRRIPALVLEP